MVSWDKPLGTAGKIALASAGLYLLGLMVALTFIVITGPVMLTLLSQPTALLVPLRSRRVKSRKSSEFGSP
jgi:multisubunit Na+/H+ antiporter MnhG subunit